MFIKIDNKFVNINHIVCYYEGDNMETNPKIHIVLTTGTVRLDGKSIVEFEEMIKQAAGIRLPDNLKEDNPSESAAIATATNELNSDPAHLPS